MPSKPPPIQQYPTEASVLAAAGWYWWQRWKRRLIVGVGLIAALLLGAGLGGVYGYDLGLLDGALHCLP